MMRKLLLYALPFLGLCCLSVLRNFQIRVRNRRTRSRTTSTTSRSPRYSEQEPKKRLQIIKFSQENYCNQLQSPLFSVLPGEIRDRIYSYALAPYDDLDAAYDDETCYKRGDYAAPQKTSTALLHTCQCIYQEAFFYPFAGAEHTLWLTAADRRPERFTTIEKLQPSLNLIHSIHGETKLASLRIFAQLYALENGESLRSILSMDHFYPRSITITIRHTDCWYWETDNPLYIGGSWVSQCRLPPSLRTFHIQIESLARKSAQVDYIAAEMIRKWRFYRTNDLLTPKDSPIEITRWSGSSTWNDQRWIRDESRPETLDYYVATVTWRPVTVAEEGESPVHTLDIPAMRGVFPMQGTTCLSTAEIEAADVLPGSSAADVLAAVTAFRSAPTSILRRRLGLR